jgi:hypothetical protein
MLSYMWAPHESVLDGIATMPDELGIPNIWGQRICYIKPLSSFFEIFKKLFLDLKKSSKKLYS